MMRWAAFIFKKHCKEQWKLINLHVSVVELFKHSYSLAFLFVCPLSLGCRHPGWATLVLLNLLPLILTSVSENKAQLTWATYVTRVIIYLQTATDWNSVLGTLPGIQEIGRSSGLKINKPAERRKKKNKNAAKEKHLLFVSCLSLCSTCEWDGDACVFSLWSLIINNAFAMVSAAMVYACVCLHILWRSVPIDTAGGKQPWKWCKQVSDLALQFEIKLKNTRKILAASACLQCFKHALLVALQVITIPD